MSRCGSRANNQTGPLNGGRPLADSQTWQWPREARWMPSPSRPTHRSRTRRPPSRLIYLIGGGLIRLKRLVLTSWVSLPFIPSALPTTPRFSGTDIKLIWWTLQSTTSIWRIPGCVAVRRSCLAFHARSRCSGSRVPVSSNPNPRTRRRWQPYRTISRCWLAGNGLVSLSVGRRRRRFGASETARHDRRLSAIRV